MIDSSYSSITIEEELKLFRSNLWDILVTSTKFNESILDKCRGDDVEHFAEEIIIAGFDVSV